MKVKNIRRDGNQVFFTVVHYDTLTDSEQETEFRTNRDGDGLFIIFDSDCKQIVGTCQISFDQKSYSGLYKAVRKWAENRYW